MLFLSSCQVSTSIMINYGGGGGIHFEQAKLSRHIHECDNNLREDAHANDDADKVEFLRQSFSK